MKQSNISEGYKNSPLGIIPNEWKVERLGISYKIQGGFAFKSELFTNQGIAIIRISNISVNRDVDLSDCVFYPFTEFVGTPFEVKSGDILIALSGATTGKSAMYRLNTIAYLNQRVGLFLQISPAINKLFLFYWIDSNTFQNQLNLLLIAGAQPNISPKDLENIKIIIPPLNEQRKIAEVLSIWDKAIEKQTLLVEKLELRKKGLMQQLLTGKKRLHGFNGEWKKEKLGKLFDERNETKMQSLPLLSITADKGIISQTASEKKDTSNEDKSKYKRICPGDIGYNTMRMWQGRCALSKLEGIVSPAYTIVSPHNDVNPFYMEMLFKQPFMVYRFWTHSQGLVNDTLNCKYPAFSQVKVTIPKIEEQNAIAEILSFCDNEITLAKQKLDTLRQQKKGLMQVLLTGKKRI